MKLAAIVAERSALPLRSGGDLAVCSRRLCRGALLLVAADTVTKLSFVYHFRNAVALAAACDDPNDLHRSFRVSLAFALSANTLI